MRRPYSEAAMNHPLDLEDLSLLVRALHRDVTDLDERLRRVEQIVHELHDRVSLSKEALDLRMIETPG
jgi:hypothetical protein